MRLTKNCVAFFAFAEWLPTSTALIQEHFYYKSILVNNEDILHIGEHKSTKSQNRIHFAPKNTFPPQKKKKRYFFIRMLLMTAQGDMEAAEEMRIKEATEMKLSELLLSSRTLPEVCHFAKYD